MKTLRRNQCVNALQDFLKIEHRPKDDFRKNQASEMNFFLNINTNTLTLQSYQHINDY